MQTRDILYILGGYLCGSMLFARLVSQLLYRRDVTDDGPDQNPGTANAFKCGGFFCGVLTLILDLAKGIMPVHFYIRGLDEDDYGIALALVIAAPVLGHVLPVFFKFRGGKGIAVFFGSLLGLFPYIMMPGLILAAVFIFFSVIVVISPHYYRTLVTYVTAGILVLVIGRCPLAVSVGFLCSAVIIIVKMLRSTEQKEELEVKLAWKH